MSKKNIRGLYAITRDSRHLFSEVQFAIRGGARVIQYRDKSKNLRKRLLEARLVKKLCEDNNVTCIINDDIELAMQVDADGVHLGKDDVDFVNARQLLGDKIIGVSCYNQLDRALLAQDQGADYVAFGRFFPSTTKPSAVYAPLSLLSSAKNRLSIPVVAIGGITFDNVKQIVDAGADSVALIEGLFAQPDIVAAANQITRHFNNTNSTTN